MRSKTLLTLLAALCLSLAVPVVTGQLISTERLSIVNFLTLASPKQDGLSLQAAESQRLPEAADAQADEPIVGLNFRLDGNLVANQPVTFIAEIAAGTNVRFRWDFGDGSSAGEGVQVEHTYPAKGIYNVTLIAENGVSIKTATRQIDISKQPLPPPVITISGARQVDIPLTFAATVNTTANVQINWEFGDGRKKTATGDSVSHSYDSVGTFVVIAEVVNLADSTDRSSATEVITIVDQPIVGFTTAPYDDPDSKHEDGHPILFKTEVDTGTNVNYRWNFGDGSPVENTVTPQLTHIYDAPGIYKVIVTAYNSVSSIDNAIDNQLFVVIEPRLEELDDDPMISCVDAGGARKIYCFAVVDQGEPATFSWNFGDGSTALGRIVDHSYAEDGKYNVRVVVRNQHPTVNFASAMHVAEIISEPVEGEGELRLDVKLMPGDDDIAPGTIIFFTIPSPLTAATEYYWDFGDGSDPVTNDGPAFHTYSGPGQYVATVTAVDEDGIGLITTDVPIFVTERIDIPLIISP